MIELLNVIPSRGVSAELAQDVFSRLIRAAAIERLADLERMAKPLRREELIVETSVQTRYPVHEAILRQARIGAADLIVIDAHRHSQLARLLLSQTDFELIRRAPIPLLIVKRSTTWRSPRVLAALDPMHAHDKALTLDDRIMQVAGTLAAVLGGSLHVGHVCVPINVLFPTQLVEPGILVSSSAEEKAHESHVRRQYHRAIRPYGVLSGRSHLRHGDPATELPLLARSIKAGLVVMGAVSRSRLKRLLVGHTAERVLDTLACDVLIVKPTGSTTVNAEVRSVSAQRAAA
jgi:universal stress protein E